MKRELELEHWHGLHHHAAFEIFFRSSSDTRGLAALRKERQMHAKGIGVCTVQDRTKQDREESKVYKR